MAEDRALGGRKTVRDRIQEQGMDEGDSVHEAFVEEVVQVLRGAEAGESVTEVEGPRVVLLVGVNGTGKTTTLGKLAHYYRNQDKTVLVAAADPLLSSNPA